VDQIIDTKCKGCEFNKSSEKDYCNNKCVFGRDLLRLGEMLGGSNKTKKIEPKIKLNKKKEVVKVTETTDTKLIKSAKVEKTKEECKRLLDEGYKAKQIAGLMGLSPNNLSTLKNNKWRLNGYRPDHKKGIVAEDDKNDVINVLKEANEKLRKALAEEKEPVETDEERAYAYETLKKDYQKKIDNQTTAYNELETQLDESFKRFDELEEKYVVVCSTLKMLL